MANEEVALKVAGEEATTIDITKGQEIDLNARDPENLHGDMRIRFHDVLGEPDTSVFSFDFIWRWAFKLFTNTKLWCYRILSLIFGLPMAIIWGIYFACLSFGAIWCFEPFMKGFAIELSCFRRIFEAGINTCYRPCFEAFGYIFYNIRIRKE